VINLESWADDASRPRRALRIDATIAGQKLQSWKIANEGEQEVLSSSANPKNEASLALVRSFEFGLPLSWLLASPISLSSSAAKNAAPVVKRLRLRFSLWQNGLPADALPPEGWIELQLLEEIDLEALRH